MTAADHPRQEAVHATVSFADLFGLPISLERLHCSLIGEPLSLLETSLAVDDLVTSGRLSRHDDMVYLAGRDRVLDNYDECAERAAASWPEAEKWALRIGQIPFVRMVAIAGGLALDAMEANAPIDVLIVVRPRRLWTTRMLINRVIQDARRADTDLRLAYLTTTRAPEIEPQTLSTAWELAQLTIVVGEEISRTLRRSNDWMFDYLPNATLDGNLDHLIEHTPSSTQKWTESLLLLPPFRLFEGWTRKRQVAQLASTGGRFSAEFCDEHLGASADRMEQQWRKPTNDT